MQLEYVLMLSWTSPQTALSSVLDYRLLTRPYNHFLGWSGYSGVAGAETTRSLPVVSAPFPGSRFAKGRLVRAGAETARIATLLCCPSLATDAFQVRIKIQQPKGCQGAKKSVCSETGAVQSSTS